MKLIEINGRYYNVPETWNELSQKQVLQVMDLVYQKQNKPERVLLKLLKILTGMSWWAFFRAPLTTRTGYCFRPKNIHPSLGVFLFLSRVQCTGLEEYLYLTEFLLTTNDLTKQLLPEVGTFAGPANELMNVTVDEFLFSEFYYEQWAENRGDEAGLNNLVAVLYRPQRRFYNRKKNPKGDLRIAFNEDLCKYYAERDIKQWPLFVKMAVVQFYEACRKKWVDSNPDVFTGGGDPAQYGLLSVMRGVAKSGIHGSTLEDVGKKMVNAILMELNELVVESREQKKALQT